MIITQTPLRISFLGGGTDFKDYYSENEGFVISSAIDKYVFVIVKERFDDLIYVNYSRKEIVDSVDKLEHELVREAMKMTGITNGVEITMLADIPSEGSGLGSSSSLIVGLLNAFYAYQGIQVTNEQLAREASVIEIEKCGRPIGKQDQYIAAFGGISAIKFKKDESVDIERIKIEESLRRRFGSNFLLFFTGITRKSSTILTEQKENTKNKFKELDRIKSLAIEAQNHISREHFEEMGNLLHKNWMIKKELSSNISNPEIEEMYESARTAGALGGKIAGAGGGGFLLLYVNREQQNSVRRALSKYKEMPFLLEKDGSKVIFNYRRYSW